jgi:hypothetical protein
VTAHDGMQVDERPPTHVQLREDRLELVHGHEVVTEALTESIMLERETWIDDQCVKEKMLDRAPPAHQPLMSYHQRPARMPRLSRGSCDDA